LAAVSQQNVELVRRSFEAHRRGGIEASIPFYAPDLVWDAGPDWVEKRIYRGHDGARELDAIFLESFEDYALELRELHAAQDSVVALYQATGRIRGSGAPIRQPVGIVLSDFRDGTIGSVRSFFSWQEAIDAAPS
jgi:ketosteroid isomerase-like protein